MTKPEQGISEALERAVARDPGGAGFAVLAEQLRRAGRRAEAEEVVTRGLLESPDSLPGRCVLLLILGDSDREDQLRGRLEAWAQEAVEAWGVGEEPPRAAAAPDAEEEGLSDDELDDAFAAAAPELDRMVTPHSVAEEAALRVDAAQGDGAPLVERPAYATRTMAELLERQGDAAGAERIRAALGAAPPSTPGPASTPAPPAPPTPRPRKIAATLERWLENARRLQP